MIFHCVHFNTDLFSSPSPHISHKYLHICTSQKSKCNDTFNSTGQSSLVSTARKDISRILQIRQAHYCPQKPLQNGSSSHPPTHKEQNFVVIHTQNKIILISIIVRINWVVSQCCSIAASHLLCPHQCGSLRVVWDKKCFLLTGKPHVNWFLHFFVNGKLTAYLKVSQWIQVGSPKGLHQSYT
jgi:hypothetical protein